MTERYRMVVESWARENLEEAAKKIKDMDGLITVMDVEEFEDEQ